MDEFLRSMTYPFLACLLLAGMHVYLGIHVIERKVIFVDLALAQIAAFGAVYGILLGYEIREDPWAVKGFSLAFAFIGAAVFSLTRTRRERVPQEAIIGITYAVALAASILASAHLPHGAEEMRELLAGSILWVRGDTLVYLAILYVVIGLFHYAFRHRFLLVSMHPEQAMAQGVRIRMWDFLFYVSFGFVVTNSVAIAGVLLVFSYLVIPAVVAVLFAERIGPRLIIGWAVGTLVSFFGVVISYVRDLP
ncbi:MAG: metal ABC transporter permease, partial [Candidatus Krumholzibacteria bacterium]|nr:metal ABC transporter permease [Candidatus Krumholzibacteria bacterium]